MFNKLILPVIFELNFVNFDTAQTINLFRFDTSNRNKFMVCAVSKFTCRNRIKLDSEGCFSTHPFPKIWLYADAQNVIWNLKKFISSFMHWIHIGKPEFEAKKKSETVITWPNGADFKYMVWSEYIAMQQKVYFIIPTMYGLDSYGETWIWGEKKFLNG